jgi:hypothetical protein
LLIAETPKKEEPYICISDIESFPCVPGLDGMSGAVYGDSIKCPKTFNLAMMRSEAEQMCMADPTTTTPTTTTMVKMVPPQMPAPAPPPAATSPPTTPKPMGTCRGPFLCDKSPITGKYFCPSKVAAKGSLCIPLKLHLINENGKNKK